MAHVSDRRLPHFVRARTSGQAPAERCSHTATLVGGRFLIIIGGGYTDPGGGPFRHFDCVHRLDTRTLRWDMPVATGPRFPARRGHTACLHGPTGRIVVFGGDSDSGLRDDVWMLDVSGTGPIQWAECAVAGSRPRPRRGHGAAILPTAGSEVMLVFGGFLEHIAQPSHVAPDETDGGSSFIHALRFTPQLRWERVTAKGDRPHALALSAYCVCGGQLVIFGGLELQRRLHGPDDFECVNSLWTVELSHAEGDEAADTDGSTSGAAGALVAMWSLGFVSRRTSALPVPRFCAAMCPIGDRFVLVFGGSRPSRDVASSASLELNEAQLFVRMPLPVPPGHERTPGPSVFVPRSAYDRPGPQEPWPEERNAMSLTRVGTRALLFGGGVYGRCYFNDVWAFQDDDVLQRPPLPPPPPLAHAVMMPHLASLVGSTRWADVAFRLPAAKAAPAGPENKTPGGPKRKPPGQHEDRMSGRHGVAVAHEDVGLGCGHVGRVGAGEPEVPDGGHVSRVGAGEPEVPDGDDFIYAHRMLLASGASSYFSALLCGSFAEGEGATLAAGGGAAAGMLELALPCQMSRATLLAVLRYLYTGELRLRMRSGGGAAGGGCQGEPLRHGASSSSHAPNLNPNASGWGRASGADPRGCAHGVLAVPDVVPAALFTAGGSEGRRPPAAPAAATPFVPGLVSGLERGGGADLDAGPETDGGPCAADASAVLEVLAAADALGIDSLRDACESLLSPRVDAATALPLLGWATRLHCRWLPELCVDVLADSFGAWAAQESATTPPRIQDQPGFEDLDDETARSLLEDMGEA